MPYYEFKGRSSNGQPIDGEIEGSSSNAVAGMLMDRGVTPISIVEKKVQIDVIELFKDRFNLHSISIEELLMFTRQMGALNKAGIPITRAISGILESVENPLLVKSLRDILEQLESGRSLSVSCARHPRVFSNLYISMIQVGENTGRLEESFTLMADYIDRNRRIGQNIKTALRYPTTVIIAIVIAMAIVNLFVIPKFASFFATNKLELPWQTLLLLNTSNFFVEYWPYILVALIAALIGFKKYIDTVDGRYRWHKFIINAPVIGEILHRSFMARFARSFAMAYSAGVPIVQAMGVISRSIGNDYISSHVNGMREGIERGEALTRTAHRTGMFTPVVMQMFAVGEEAGNLDEMMTFIADFYEEEVDYDVKTLSDKIEPLIYVAIGALVLVLALGIFVPMWDVAQLAGR
ncbi:MAG: type II secretion system F family protein [Gammaproteobacteria bacterium]|nr:type II secretion system F family protein [Gammaproteobacteria bacterium]MDH3449070.1 type II secretion system F family protein [Gammaproteobacteria bacterium]